MVEQLEAEYEIEADWRPFLLRPDMPPEGMRLPEYLRQRYASTGERLKRMAQEAGMRFTAPEVLPNSRRALEASEYAREQGRHEAFHRVVFRKFYGEGQDLSDWKVLRAAAEEVGLDPEAMQRQTEGGSYREAVIEEFGRALAIGITGIPTYILDGKFFVVGAQPYGVFLRALRRLGAEGGDHGGR